MRKKQLFIPAVLVVWVLLPAIASLAIEQLEARPFVGQDLHLVGDKLESYQPSTNEHILVFQGKFSMSVGANQFFSDNAVIWLGTRFAENSESIKTEFRNRTYLDYDVIVYLQGNISVKKTKSAKTTDLSWIALKDGRSMVVQFVMSGEVFVTADEREVTDPRGLELYTEALAAVAEVGPAQPKFVVGAESLVPGWAERPPKKEAVVGKPERPSLTERTLAPEKLVKPPEVAAEPEVKFRYPVNIAPAGEAEPKIDWAEAPDGTEIATVIGRLYLWQKQDEKGRLLELQADNAIVWYSGEEPEAGTEGGVLAKPGFVKAVYICGDVVMTEGQRTIRADELYYDFENKKAIAINAVMRNFDINRGIPIYVRAAKLKQLAENKFAAENPTLTSSEFYLPQISLTASEIIITDTTAIDQQEGRVSDSSFDAQMRDVCLRVGEKTIFHWPFMRSDLQRPDVPIKSIHAGYDSDWGATVETRWHLARLLGLWEPQGTDSTFDLDYYGERGLGSGVEVEYEREDYFGRLLGYVIRDSGEDRLGRHDSRRHLEPDNELRGRFHFQHRHFLPYNWQLTTETSYASDEHFIEAFYRGEFNTGKEQETIVHMKRIEDNWGLSILGKARINDFADKLEELPSAEFHLAGRSLFEDKFTLYSDTQVSRLRQRIGDEHSTLIDEQRFSFMSHRTELDMPLWADNLKIVPFVAGTFGYDDRSGFTRTLVDGSNTGSFGEDTVGLGEIGVRIFPQPYWRVYPNVKSRLWDLEGLRHVVRPQLTAVCYADSDSVVEQRDTLNVGIFQRLQTKRAQGPAAKQQRRTVDWMRLDTHFTWVSDSESADATGPDRFIWNQPAVPLRVLSAPEIFNGDLISGLGRFEMFGPRRNYFSADYVWRLSDTGAILSDGYFDMQSGVVQQFNFGFSHMRWPNLSYYIGNRYLRRVEVLDEKGSNAFIFAATYILDPRYTMVYSTQFDFDYGANIRSDITLIRRYHRMYCSVTFSADESLDRQAVVFSIWPQGVPEAAIGNRRYMKLGGSAGY